MEKNNDLLLDVFEDLPYKAKSLIFGQKDMLKTLDYISIMIEGCESPIEKIFFVALINVFISYDLILYVDNQTLIESNEKKYYADFTIEHDELCNRYLKKDFKLVIECDGYEFHQKTKEQVDNDNQREYDIKMSGWEIIRFSGRELYNNPIECAKKVIRYIATKNYDKG